MYYNNSGFIGSQYYNSNNSYSDYDDKESASEKVEGQIRAESRGYLQSKEATPIESKPIEENLNF